MNKLLPRGRIDRFNSLVFLQPAIDAFTLALTREFNQRTTPNSLPLVFGTYQSYLRRGLPHLQASLEDANKYNYVLGVKLVRGAYQPLEVATHKANYEKGSPTYRGDADAPVWYEKPDTDATYNAVSLTIGRIVPDFGLT